MSISTDTRPELVPDASPFTELDIIHQRAKALIGRVYADEILFDNMNEDIVTRHLQDAVSHLRSALEQWGP